MLTTNNLKYLSRVVNYELGIDFKFHSLRHPICQAITKKGKTIYKFHPFYKYD